MAALVLSSLTFISGNIDVQHLDLVICPRKHHDCHLLYHCCHPDADCCQYSLNNKIRLTHTTPRLFHVFEGDSIIRVLHLSVDNNWLGFLFTVEFKRENFPTNFGSPHRSSSSLLPHPFYLSFESESAEERFDMPLNLELDRIDGSQHIWTIYISKEHCHFIESGAHITFKASPGVVVKRWGIRRIIKQDINLRTSIFRYIRQVASSSHHLLSDDDEDDNDDDDLYIRYVKKSRTSSGPKIQLPYNWQVTEEDEVEKLEAKAKENNLCNLGL